MEELFKPEVVQQFLEILKSATEGSVTVLIVYFLLPLLMLLTSSVAWVFGIWLVLKNVCNVVLKFLNREIIKVTRIGIGEHFIDAREGILSFVDVLREIKSTSYVHRSDLDYLKTAIRNQKILDDFYSKTHHNPTRLSESMLEKLDKRGE